MNELRIYNQLLSECNENALPPLEKWNPTVTGDIDIRIAADGAWFHEGAPIQRAALVRLFASVLWHEDGEYFLVTPVEKVRIQVDDAPLVVTQAEFVGEDADQQIFLTTLTGDRFLLDREHPLRVEHTESDEPRPYVRVRRNLDALVHRNVFYLLVDHAFERHTPTCIQMVLRSAQIDFILGEFPL